MSRPLSSWSTIVLVKYEIKGRANRNATIITVSLKRVYTNLFSGHDISLLQAEHVYHDMNVSFSRTTGKVLKAFWSRDKRLLFTVQIRLLMHNYYLEKLIKQNNKRHIYIFFKVQTMCILYWPFCLEFKWGLVQQILSFYEVLDVFSVY